MWSFCTHTERTAIEEKLTPADGTAPMPAAELRQFLKQQQDQIKGFLDLRLRSQEELIQRALAPHWRHALGANVPEAGRENLVVQSGERPQQAGSVTSIEQVALEFDDNATCNQGAALQNSGSTQARIQDSGCADTLADRTVRRTSPGAGLKIEALDHDGFAGSEQTQDLDKLLSLPPDAELNVDFENPLGIAPKLDEICQRQGKIVKHQGQSDFNTRMIASIRSEYDVEEEARKEFASSLDLKKLEAPALSALKSTRRNVESCLGHPAVEIAIALLILVNSVLVGAEADWHVNHPGNHQTPNEFVVSGYIFNIVFGVEVFVRCFAYGRRFFTGSQRAWNVFDSFLVLTSIMEGILQLLKTTAVGNMYNMRLVRLIRIARILRVIRVARIVRLLIALRLLLVQLVGTLRACFWALILLLMVLYMFGMAFAQSCSDYATGPVDEYPDTLLKYWGTVPRAMFTLYMSVTGGISWQDVIAPLSQIHWSLVVGFNVFLAFTVFAVLNVVVGVFCQQAIESANMDHENTIRRKIRERIAFKSKVKTLFDDLDASGIGSVTYHDLWERSNDLEFCAYFESLGLDATDAWDLFKLLDKDGSTLIDCDEFVNGCVRLKGFAKVIDVERLQYENRHMRKRLWAFIQRTETALQSILSALVQPTETALQRTHSCRDSGGSAT